MSTRWSFWPPLVQREINSVQDAGGVASVYWNRIFKPAEGTVGLLQSDPSVEYARDFRDEASKILDTTQ